MDTTGDLIKELLKRKNLKQKDLAAMMGVQSSAVSQWVTGKTQVDPKNLPQLAHVLGVTVDALLAGSHQEVTNGESGIFTTGNIASVRPHIREFYTLVPFLTARAQAGIPLMSYENFTTDLIEETYPVFLPIIAIDERHLAIEISGDSMEPSIIERAVVLVEAIAKGDIKYESGGVYAVLYGTGRFVVKRVKTNDLNTNGTLTLWSDNERYGHIVVQGDDIHRMWKVIEKVREPVR